MKSIADVVSAAGLQQYAEVALLIFFGVFIAVTLRLLSTNKESIEHASRLPLVDDPRDGAPSPQAPAAPGGRPRVQR